MGDAVRYVFVPADYADELTVTQLGIAVALMRRAAWSRREVALRSGGTVVLERGEALFGEQSLADELGVSRSTIRKAVRRLELALGAETRAARGLPQGRDEGLSRGRARGLPASILRFGKHRDFIFPERGGAYPGADRGAEVGAEGGAPYYPDNPALPLPPMTDPRPADAAAGRASSGAQHKTNGASDPRHRPLRDRLAAAYRDVCGGEYGFQGGKDAKAIARLLGLSGGDLDEVERRWRRALDLGSRWPGCRELASFAGRWNELAGPAAAASDRGPQPVGQRWDLTLADVEAGRR